MERLTNHFDYCKMIECKYYDEELHKQNKCKFFDVDISHCHEKSMNDKLREYEDAEEQGLLIRLPCKVGDVVYTNMRASGWYKREKNKPYKANVAFIGINGKDNFMNVVFENDNVLQFLLSDIGKTVFLTREEAEAALERMNKNA